MVDPLLSTYAFKLTEGKKDAETAEASRRLLYAILSHWGEPSFRHLLSQIGFKPDGDPVDS
jgi:hypothetical protein